MKWLNFYTCFLIRSGKKEIHQSNGQNDFKNCQWKNNKIDPSNYQDISLFSFPAILLQRIKQQSEEFIEENQYEFCLNRGTADAILIVQKYLIKPKNAR